MDGVSTLKCLTLQSQEPPGRVSGPARCSKQGLAKMHRQNGLYPRERGWLLPFSTASGTGTGVNQGATGLRGVNPRGAARDVDGSSIKSGAAPLPLRPPAPHPLRRAPRGSAPPRPGPSPWPGRSQARGRREPRSPGGLCAPSRHGPGRCAPFGVGPGPGPYAAAGRASGPPRNPRRRASPAPAPPRGPRLTRFPGLQAWSPTSQSRPSRPPSTCRTSGPARRSTAATSTGPEEGNARRGALSFHTPGPPGAPPFPVAYFRSFCLSRPLLHGSF